MANGSVVYSNVTQSQSQDVTEDVFEVLWISGIVVSVIGWLVQVWFFVFIPNCRKFDEKVLTQMSCARILNTMCEYHIIYLTFYSAIVSYIVYAIYVYTDFVLVCWMFVFTKNLYDKVVLVFTTNCFKITIVSVLIWILCLPIGLMCPVLMKINMSYFFVYYKGYAHVKFFIVIINALIYIEIFRVAFTRGAESTKKVKHFIKTAIVAFILICTSSLQMFVTDMLSYYTGDNKTLITSFCVLNSFQVVAVTGIFVILAKRNVKDSIARSFTIRFREFIA